MEAPIPVTTLVPSQKRPFEDDAQPSTPNRPSASTASTPLSVLSMDTPSPLQKPAFTNQANTPSAAPSTAPTLSQATPAASTNAQPPAKRRKITDQEKEAQRLEKEAKAKARAEKKEQKEAEDKLKAEQKAEEKKKKDEEKKKKDEEKKKKEDEKRRKEEEKLKKERSQLKLNAFFVKPKVSADSAGKSMVDNVQDPTTGPTLLAPDTGMARTNSAPPSPQKAIQKDAKSDYDRFFLPFSPAPNTTIAPWNAHLEDSDALAASKARMEKVMAQEDVEMEPVTIETYRTVFPKRRRGLDMMPIPEIVDLVNGSADKPIDLTGSTGKSRQEPLALLKQIPMKYLHFSEDVRPPYYGTYTKPHSIAEGRRLARNPISRGLEELDYDYDSEAEWEEPEEGEDLDSEGEEDLDDDGDEDLDGFLDDDDDTNLKRRLVNGDQEPVSSGLCWEDVSGVSILNDGSGAICTDFRDFKMGFLLDPQPQTIDPFSTSYWVATAPTLPPVPGQPTIKNAVNGLMNPPRLPLTSRPANVSLNTLNPASNASPTSSLATPSKGTKPKQTIPADQLPAFKAEIDGQDLTKIAMIEALKKKFPKLGKQAITDTLGLVAKRVGSSQKEKVWVLL
ncbi:hypothetical protein DM02DRAFT_618856 [Periconia macrospinosa]|uniref:Chromatin assembly factor 1 subunit A n=1 Tax=Periconia macrospinosa TaxID=97972 RepID=A0A2V1DA58_9PLEO|nr:hypothetical protein DM02DRAFT_618856 [Periconia macrospinosa]